MIKVLFRDTLIYGLAAIISRGLSLLALPIYTRMLAPADYGALDMIMVAGSLATLIVALEVSQALSRFYADASNESARRIMASTALWFTILSYSVALLAAMAAAEPLAAALLGPGMDIPFRIGASYIAINGIFYLIQNQLRFELRSKAYSALSLLYAVSTVGLSALLGYVLDLGLNGVLLAQLAAASLAVGLGLRLLHGSFGLCFDRQVLREMLVFSMPLVPSGLATFLTLYANRLLLNAMTSLEAVGLFGVATRIAGAAALLIVGLQAALTPLIYVHYKEPETPARLAKIVEGFTSVAFACCLALGLFAQELLTAFTEPRYWPAAGLVLALAPATLLNQMYIFFPGIAIARKTYQQLAIFVVTASIGLLTNWLFIRAFGLVGAVLATLLTSMLFLGLWISTSQRLYALPIRWMRVALFCTAYAAAGLAGLEIQGRGLSPAETLQWRLALLMLFVASAPLIGLIRVSDLRAIVNHASKGGRQDSSSDADGTAPFR